MTPNTWSLCNVSTISKNISSTISKSTSVFFWTCFHGELFLSWRQEVTGAKQNPLQACAVNQIENCSISDDPVPYFLSAVVTKKSVKLKKIWCKININVALGSRYSLFGWVHMGIAPPKFVHAEYKKDSVYILYSTYVFTDYPRLNIDTIIICPKSLTYFPFPLHLWSSLLGISGDP